MSALMLGAAMVAGLVVLGPLADRLHTPLPVLLTMFGMLLALLPAASALRVDPGLILPVVLPPLLFAATQRSTAHEFRSQARPILVLAVGLTVASAGLAATVAHWLGLGWGAAWVLGAVVAPPDPVAATAVARRLRLPQGLVTVLEGEGMFNDATALVLYAVAVDAVLEGRVTTGHVAQRLVLAVVGGLLVGLGAGLLARLALGVLTEPATETTVTLAVPFLAYLGAEEIHGSGVLAVLTVGLYLRSYGHRALSSEGWLLGRAVWRYGDYLITSMVFVLIGYELTAVVKSRLPPAEVVRLAAVVVTALVVLRPLWILVASWVDRVISGRGHSGMLQRMPEVVVAGWAGMRGVVTVATALAVPLRTSSGAAFPQRDEIAFVGLACVAATLVVQGLTLAPLIRLTGVGSDADPEAELVDLRRQAAKAGQRVVADQGRSGVVSEEVLQVASMLYQQREQWHQALIALDPSASTAANSAPLSEVLALAADAERTVVLEARRRGEVTSEAADDVLEEIESRALRWASL